MHLRTPNIFESIAKLILTIKGNWFNAEYGGKTYSPKTNKNLSNHVIQQRLITM